MATVAKSDTPNAVPSSTHVEVRAMELAHGGLGRITFGYLLLVVAS